MQQNERLYHITGQAGQRLGVGALRHTLVAAGFTPLPLFGKTPPAYGKNGAKKGLGRWQHLENVTSEQIDLWGKTWPDAINTGVLTKFTPALDLDICNTDAARACEDLVRARFEQRGTVLVRIGKSPKRAVLFRTDAPFAKTVATITAANGSAEKLEFLGDGQQVVVDGIHPETKQPYHWPDGEPGRIRREELPPITADEAQTLIDDLVELLVRDFGYCRPEKRRRTGRAQAGHDGSDWTGLLDNIDTGNALHDSLRDLAAKLAKAGTHPGAAINLLRAHLEQSAVPHDERWQERMRDIPRLVDSATAKFAAPPEPAPAPAETNDTTDADVAAPATLAEVHAVFRRWLGDDYDLATLDAMLATVAAEKLPGDPAWLLIISGSGNAKTETVQATSGLRAEVVSTITSEGALLSASAVRKQKAKLATGGLLRKLGERGILAIKDVTSILSSDRNTRAAVLAALREIHDGHWVRNVGVDGGRTLEWKGRITVIGACTTAWDQAHSVVAVMGDRFVLIRSSSHTGRIGSGLRAIHNTGKEVAMRAEMAAAVSGLIGTVEPDGCYALSEEDQTAIVKAADFATLARTGIEQDYRGEVIDAHDPEMPTRLAKQLTQIMRGASATGMDRTHALNLALRCAKDSVPQLRLAVLLDLASHPGARVIEVRRRLQRPRMTIDRTLQALHILGLLHCREEEEERGGRTVQTRFYSLAAGINPDVLYQEQT
jgi:hypothetical protein